VTVIVIPENWDCRKTLRFWEPKHKQKKKSTGPGSRALPISSSISLLIEEYSYCSGGSVAEDAAAPL
jgi:hypothetical protein